MTQDLFILDRGTIDSATDLMARFGAFAEQEAAIRAADSRDRGNVHHFCRWRQIERIVAALEQEGVQGTIH